MKKRRKEEAEEPTLFDLADGPNGVENVSRAFRKLYYHLYTNSQASRAERIVSDLSLLLLVKLAVEVNGGGKLLESFLEGKQDSQSALLPFLRKAYPNLTQTEDRFGMGDDALRESLFILKRVRLSE